MNKEPKVKITVLKAFEPNEVFPEPLFKEMENSPCNIHKEGQVFYCGGRYGLDPHRNEPEGFCAYAWNAIFPYVTTMMSGGDFESVYKEPGVAVIACPDGLRPVIFKLELLR